MPNPAAIPAMASFDHVLIVDLLKAFPPSVKESVDVLYTIDKETIKGGNIMKTFAALAITGLLLSLAPAPYSTAFAAQQNKPQLEGKSSASRGRTTALIADEVRHQLVMLPNYGVFDWIDGTVAPDDSVTLRGFVTAPTTRSDAEARVKKLESVAKVVNQIEVLPLSSSDDQIRLATYRAIFNYNGPLFRYATRAVPPIHIIVKNGHLTLKGVVANQMDSQLAYMAARGVSGVFDVKNELEVEKT